MATYQKNWRSSHNDYFNKKRSALYSSSSRVRSFNLGAGTRKKSGLHRLSVILSGLWPFGKKPGSHTIIKVFGGLFLLGLLFVLILFAYYSKDLPDPNKLNSRLIAESTKIYDRNGELLYNVYDEAKRTLIDFGTMPQSIKDATVAIEDKDFYKHKGLDFSRIVSSTILNVINLDLTGQGASTITQQFIRNALLTREKLFSRKIKEAILAIQIERKLSKDEILKLYLNEVPYGSNAYGIQAASQTFFDKNASELSLAESAYLAALPQSPTTLSPYGPNRDRLEARKNTVLQLMYDQGYITQEQRDGAQNEQVEFVPPRNVLTAPHFVLYIQDVLVKKYGEKMLREGGLQVTTSLDLSMQKIAEETVAEQGEKNQSQYGASNAALVAIDPRNGQVMAMVGSRDYFNDEIEGKVNVAMRPRQPGSSFKPYVYATAFKEGYAPANMLMDVVTNFGNFGGEDYVPQNYGGKIFGPVSMRQALAGSLNIPAVKTIMLVGIKDAIDTARAMGISTLTDSSRYGPSLVLGGGEVLLIDHVSAFGVFATGGIRHEPVTILKITDSKGDVLEEHDEQNEGKRVLDEQVAFLINSVLSDNGARSFIFGAQNRLTLPGRPVAAKTGTTQNYKDAWTVGYTPQLAAGVWVGNNNGTEMRPGADGSVVAAPIWNSFMRRVLEGKPAENFGRPGGIRDIAVDKISGKLPTEYTPETKPEVFASFAVPEEYDDVHVPIRVDKRTGQPATGSTPEDQVVAQIYTILHSEMPNKENWERPVKEWAVSNGYSYPGIEGGGGTVGEIVSLSITEPQDNDKVTELPLKITASAGSSSGINKLIFYFDGKEIFSNNSESATFFFSVPQSNGEHVVRVTAESGDGARAEASKKVTYDLEENLVISKPNNGGVVSFPYEVAAYGSSNYNQVEFFYQKGELTPVRIAGSTEKAPQGNGTFSEYRLVWQGNESPSAGQYRLYAQSNTGKRSPSIYINIVP